MRDGKTRIQTHTEGGRKGPKERKEKVYVLESSHSPLYL